MAIGSSLSRLTKGVRRTGEKNTKNNKSQLEDSSKTNSSNFTKRSNQGDSDSSEATSFSSSSVHGSTTSSGTSFSSTTTERRYSNISSGIERGNHQRKTTHDNLNSQKVTSRRRQQSRLTSLPDDDPVPVEPSPDLQKPMIKFSRSGSLRSLKIVRKKNMSSSESKNSSTVKDTHSKKATFSSILKDSKFPEQVEPQVGVKESEEVVSAAKLCSYEHCSLHGNHHNHEPPIKRFSYLKRRPSKDQKSINPQSRPTDKQSVKKKEAKVIKKVSKEDVDFSIEFYAKTRSEPSFEPNCSRDDLRLVDVMFGFNGTDDQKVIRNLQMNDKDRSIVNIDGSNDSTSDGFGNVEGKKPGFNNDNQMSMWRIIHRHMVSGLIEQQLQEEKQSCFENDDVVDQGKEVQKMLAIKNIVREAIEKILLPEEDGSEKSQGDDQTEPSQAANDLFGTKKDKPRGWNYVKKVVLMRRFIAELEKAKKKLDRDKRGHVPLVPEAEPEAEIVTLRSQTTGDKKNTNEWMLDYALQQVVAELAPTQKRKVALLVKSFEMISPKLDKRVAI